MNPRNGKAGRPLAEMDPYQDVHKPQPHQYREAGYRVFRRETIQAIQVEENRFGLPADKEIIVIDDCSSDGTPELLRNEIETLVDRVIYQEVTKKRVPRSAPGFAPRAGTSC
jgi:hypothetical protein